jgi:hypothetical protein
MAIVPFKSNHSLCDTIDGKLHCIEVFLDNEMRLLNVSEPYEKKAGEVAVIHSDGFMVETRKFADLDQETIKQLTHNGAPNQDQLEARPDSNDDSRVTQESELKTGGCSSCAENDKKKKAGMLMRLARGVPGLLKSELGIDQAEPSVVDKRKSICLNCPEGIYNFGVCDEERGGCGCFLASKVTIEGESCPKGHW